MSNAVLTFAAGGCVRSHSFKAVQSLFLLGSLE